MNDERGKHRRLLRPAPLLALAAALPALAAAVRATAQRWYPTLDNGIYSARAWDVGTSHNPMLATWSSRSTATGIIMNHPGPMAFQLLAPFRRLFGPVGVRIGSAFINAGAAGSVVWMAWRVGRRRGVATFGLGVLVLSASMGSEVLSDPWTHNLPLLAFFAAAVGLWASMAGDRWGPTMTVFWASQCAQTSLAYVVLSAALVGTSLLAGIGWWWADRRRERAERRPPTGSKPADDERGTDHERDATHTVEPASVGATTEQHKGTGHDEVHAADAGPVPAAVTAGSTNTGRRLPTLLVAVGVLVALWTLPAWEQFVAPDGAPGNVTAMAENADRLGGGRGIGFAVQTFADTVLIPPAWAFPDPATWENSTGARWDVGPSVAVFGAYLAVLAGAAWWARRRRSVPLMAVAGAAGVVTLASLATLANISETTFATAAYLRWLFPVGAFIASGLALVALDAVLTAVPGTERLPALARSGAGAAAALAIVVGLTVYSVDAHGLESGSPSWANGPASELHSALADAPRKLAERGPVLTIETPYLTSLTLFPAVIDELLAAGADLRFEPDTPLLAQFGVGRTATGDEQWELSTRSGVAANTAAGEPGIEVLARFGTADPSEFGDLGQRAENLAARIDATTLIAAPGLARTDTGLYFDQAAVGRTLDDPIVSLYDGTLIALTRRNVVEVPDDLLAEIEAFASDLERRDHAFAVVVQPAGYDPPVPQGPVIALPGGGNDPDRWTPN